MIGGYWALPLQYIQNAIAINEFTGGRFQLACFIAPVLLHLFYCEYFIATVALPIGLHWHLLDTGTARESLIKEREIKF